jgi:hypothetical protein
VFLVRISKIYTSSIRIRTNQSRSGIGTPFECFSYHGLSVYHINRQLFKIKVLQTFHWVFSSRALYKVARLLGTKMRHGRWSARLRVNRNVSPPRRAPSNKVSASMTTSDREISTHARARTLHVCYACDRCFRYRFVIQRSSRARCSATAASHVLIRAIQATEALGLEVIRSSHRQTVRGWYNTVGHRTGGSERAYKRPSYKNLLR